MSKEDKTKEDFRRAQGTGNLDEGMNEPIKVPWTDSVSTKPTEYTMKQHEKKSRNNKRTS